jgi:cytochrome c oxidase cbb3-type subunit 3
MALYPGCVLSGINLGRGMPRSVLAGLLVSIALPAAALAQDQNTSPPTNKAINAQPAPSNAPTDSEALINVPVSGITPGAVKVQSTVKVPTFDKDAAQRGMQYYTSFNCVGCHMGNGGGGMGPALSNHAFIYGSEPEKIFLSIYQGRPYGMPAWGTVLPETTIWDLVAYIKQLSNAPSTEWGSTTSPDSPDVEQVPGELQSGADPWLHTQKFSKGQKPTE